MRIVLPIVIVCAIALTARAAIPATNTSPDRRYELTADPPKAPLGENTEITFSMVNTGKTPIQLDDIGGFGDYIDPRFKLTATAADGSAVPTAAVGLIRFDRIVRSVDVAPGGRWSVPLDLAAYCWIDQPGTYKVRCTPDRDSPFGSADDFPQRLECTVAFTQPTAVEAQAIFARACKTHEVDAALRPMHEAIYLPMLLKLYAAKPAWVHRALQESYLPQTTQELLKIFGGPAGDEREWADEMIQSRIPGVPDWEGGDVLSWLSTHRPAQANPWQPSMAKTLLAIAMKRVGGADEGAIADAGIIIEEFGEAGDGPQVVAATTRVIAREISPQPPQNTSLPMILAEACARVIKQGYLPSTTPKSFGENVAYLEAIKNLPTFRPAGWATKCAQWTASPSPTIRLLALMVQPNPISAEMAARMPAMLADSDTQVVQAACRLLQQQKVPGVLPILLKLMKTSGQVSFDAFEAAVMQGGRLPALEAAVDQIDDNNGLLKLCNVLEHGDNIYVDRASKLDDIPSLRRRWHEWIDQHRDELAAGKKFNRDDPAFAGKLFPSQVQFHFADGSLWPPYADGETAATAPAAR